LPDGVTPFDSVIALMSVDVSYRAVKGAAVHPAGPQALIRTSATVTIMPQMMDDASMMCRILSQYKGTTI
jgi:hypothetical protein